MPDKLKNGWSYVSFGDVVQLCREKSNDPADDGYDRYVGLEHLDPGDLKIRRWGNVANGTTFSSVFRAGQVLFGKRRSYQRKLAVPDFDGVCSGDIYVFKPKNDHLLPELLPFICQTDGFFDHAVGTSAGSLSPRTNWESLVRYKFALPPLDEQWRIAEVLQAFEKSILSLQFLINRTALLKRSAALDLFVNGINHSSFVESVLGQIPYDWNVVPLEEVADKTDKYSFTGGPFGSNLKVSDYMKEGVRIIQLQNIGDGEFLDDYRIYTSEIKADELISCNIYPGDIIMAKMGDPVARAAIIPESASRYLMASDGIRLSIDTNRVNKKYILELINSALFRQQAERVSRGTTRKRIGLIELRQILIPLPSFKEQNKIAAVFEAIDRNTRLATERLQNAQKIKGALISDVLTGGVSP